MTKQQQKLFNEQNDWNLESALKELLSLNGYDADALFAGEQWEPSEVLSTKKDVNTDQIAIAKKAAEQQAEDKFRIMLEQSFGVPANREHGDIKQVLDLAKVKLSQADPTIQNELYATRQQVEIYKESLTAKEREIANVHNQYKVRASLEETLSKFKTANMPKDWILRGIEDDLSSKYLVSVEAGKLQIRDRATQQIPKNPLGKEIKAEDVILDLLKDRNLIDVKPEAPKKEVPIPQGQNVTTTQQPAPSTQLNADRLAHLQRAQARMAGTV
jgi:hypothetical protein